MRRQPTFTRADRLEHLMADEVERLLSYDVRSPHARRVKVVHVRLSPDLGHLRVQYVMLDGTEPPKAVQDALDQSASYVGRTLAETLQLRKRPTVAFGFDRDASRAHRVVEILKEDAARRPAETAGEAGEASEPGAAEPGAAEAHAAETGTHPEDDQ